MMKDLARVLAVRPKVHIGIVQDGAPELWRLMDEALERAGLRSRKVHRLIDMYHLMKRLSAALGISDPTATAFARSAKLQAWKKLLLSDPAGIEKIADYFELQSRLHRALLRNRASIRRQDRSSTRCSTTISWLCTDSATRPAPSSVCTSAVASPRARANRSSRHV
jgi:hypothetical protein